MFSFFLKKKTFANILFKKKRALFQVVLLFFVFLFYFLVVFFPLSRTRFQKRGNISSLLSCRTNVFFFCQFLFWQVFFRIMFPLFVFVTWVFESLLIVFPFVCF